jgi:hypothetical protein
VTKKRRRPSAGTIGAILVGFDQQVFRTLPPPHELVVKSTPTRGSSGQAPGLEVVFPEDLVVGDAPSTVEQDADV